MISPRSSLPVLLLLIGAACGVGSTSRAQGSPGADPGEVRRILSVLAADSMEGRATGTAGAARAARFIAAELTRYGISPGHRTGGYFQPVLLARTEGGAGLRLASSREAWEALPAERRVQDANVVGVLPGSDPALRGQAVIVGAHLDHEGIGRAVDGDSIYNGADDDASGVTAVLSIARALKAGPPPRRTVIFLLTTGEEQGLLGTRAYIEQPVVPLDSTVADLQIEMVGRPDSVIGGVGRGWLTGFERSSLGPELAAAGVPIVADPRPAQQFFQRSDNIAFACRGIPAHTLSSFGLHEDYHRPGDELERIDIAHLTSIIEAATRAVRLLADGSRPAWVPGGDPSRDPSICG